LKYVVLIGDGMADYPVPELDGLTPLASAETPNLDRLARGGLVARARTIPEGLEPGSDVANLSLLGYDPVVYGAGRGPLEAASLGVPLEPEDIAFRCNLVTLSRDGRDRPVMADYAAGHITTPDARPYLEALARELNDRRFRFHPGTSYRHLLVWSGGRDDVRLTPPHDLSTQVVAGQLDDLAREAPELFELTRRSWEILPRVRPAEELASPPNSIWLWGQGRPPLLKTLDQRFALKGAVISAVDLVKGLGVFAGLELIPVEGATGWLDTDYAGKVAAGLAALKRVDLLYLHVEAPDEAGHTGRLELKLKAIADFDAQVVGPLIEGLEELGRFRLLVTADHYTPLAVMTHTPEPVPLILFDSAKDLGAGSPRAASYSENEAAKGPDLGPAHRLMERLVRTE